MLNHINKILLLNILLISTLLSSDIILTSKENSYLKNKKEIKICIDPDWFPFEKFDIDGNYVGISSEYFKLFQKQLNIKIKPIKTISWSQSLEFSKQRKCDILALANETPKRKKYLNFTAPYLKIPFVMATKTNVNFINHFSHITNKRIGVTKNSALVEILHDKYPNFILVKVKNNQEGIDKLQNNELYGYVGNMVSIRHILKTNFITNLKIISKLDDEQSKLAIGIRNDDEILYNIFNKLISNLSLEESQLILHKYTYTHYEQHTENFIHKYLEKLLIVVVTILIILLFIQFHLKQVNKTLNQKVKKEIEINREKELQLIHQSRLAQMGEMVSMIAHQWRQPLSSISSTVTTLELKVIMDEYDSTYFTQQLKNISNYSQYLSSTIDDFRNFYKSSDVKIQIKLEEIINNALKIIEPSLDSKGIKINKYYKSNQSLLTYANEVQQVIINILQNAQDILIQRDINNPTINISIDISEEMNIIEIIDNANGISEDIILKIFDPYFTTKDTLDGTGLGLFMSKKIIENRCNGKLLVFNKNNGAVFKILLPKDKNDR